MANGKLPIIYYLCELRVELNQKKSLNYKNILLRSDLISLCS